TSTSLLRLPTAGGSPTVLRTGLLPLNYNQFAFDGSFFYFVDGDTSNNTNRIRKLTKSGSSLTTFAEAPLFGTGAKGYFVPRSTGSMLYWIEWQIDAGNTVIRRKNLTNGNVVTKDYAATQPIFLNLLPDRIVTGGFTDTNQGTTLIARGDL